MAIDPKLVSIIPASQLPTGDPTSAADFLFYEGDALKKGSMSNIYDRVASGIKGIATQTNAPTPYTAETYPNGLFERYIVNAPLTSPNSWGNIAVTNEELKQNFVYLNVTNGVVVKELSSKLKGDDGKTIEAYDDEESYVEGSQIFFEGKIYQTTTATAAGENPTSTPTKFSLVFEAVQRSILAPIEGEPSDEIGKVGQNIIATVNGFDWLYTKEVSGWSKIYQLTVLGNGFYKSKKGVIENTDLKGWDYPGSYSVVNNPSYISWGKLGKKIGQKALTDAMGRREGHLFIDDDGKWYLYYGSSANTDSGWRPQLDVSDDEGLTWRKKGDTSIGRSNGTGGTFPARDMLYMNKFNGVYYIFPMTAASHMDSVCVGPYFSDVWKYEGSDLENATWEYVRYQLPPGLTNYTGGGSYLGSMVKKPNGEYVIFFSVNPTVTTYAVGIATTSSPDGIANPREVPLLPERFDFIIENPKVFYSPHFGKWVMLNNSGTKSSGRTSQNLLLFSDDLEEWNFDDEINTSNVSQLDGLVAVGIHSPLYLPEGEIIQTPDGRIPLTFDSLNSEQGSIGNHTNRDLWYTVLEPSKTKMVRSVSEIYVEDFTSDLLDPITLTNYNPLWETSGANPFNVMGKSTTEWGNLKATGSGRDFAIYNHVLVNGQSISLSLGGAGGKGVLFNYMNPLNYEFIYMAGDHTLGHYEVVNGVQALITNFEVENMSLTLNNITLSIFNGQIYLILNVKNRIINGLISPFKTGSRSGLLHDGGLTYYRRFEILNSAFVGYITSKLVKSYDFKTATHLMSPTSFSPDLTLTLGTASIYNLNGVEGLFFPESGESIVMLPADNVNLKFNFELNGSIGLIYNYVDSNNYRLLDLSKTLGTSRYYQKQNGNFIAGAFNSMPYTDVEITEEGEFLSQNTSYGFLEGFTPGLQRFGFRNGSGYGNRVSKLSRTILVQSTDLTIGNNLNSPEKVSNGVFEFSAYNPKFDSTPLYFKFREQDDKNYYFVSFGLYSHFIIGRMVNGIPSVLKSYTSVETILTANNPIRVRVVLENSKVTVFLNGFMLEYPGLIYDEGSYGFKTFFSHHEIRNFRFYKSDKINILGTQQYQKIVIRSAGVPIYEGITDSEFTTISLSHYPADEIIIEGVSQKFTNLIWGGDTIIFNV